MEADDIPICVICRVKLSHICVGCELSRDPPTPNIVPHTKGECNTLAGRCGHVYHRHCIKRWLKYRTVCPIDNREWRSTEIESLQTLCVREIVSDQQLIIDLAASPIATDPVIGKKALKYVKPFAGDINIDINIMAALGEAFCNYSPNGQINTSNKIHGKI